MFPRVQKLIIIASSFLLHFVVLVLFVLSQVFKTTDFKPPEPLYGYERAVKILCDPSRQNRRFSLRRVDFIAYEEAKLIAQHPLLDLKNTKFYVSCHPLVVQQEGVVVIRNGKVLNEVYLSPFILRSRHFDAVVSHELAHIKMGHTLDLELSDDSADELAEKVIPWWEVEEWRESAGFPYPMVLLDRPAQ